LIVAFQLTLHTALHFREFIKGHTLEGLSPVQLVLWVVAYHEPLLRIVEELLTVGGDPGVGGGLGVRGERLLGCQGIVQSAATVRSIQRDINFGLVKLRGILEELEMTLSIDGEQLRDCAGHDFIQDFKLHHSLLLLEFIL
jgi:hypothetical protein